MSGSVFLLRDGGGEDRDISAIDPRDHRNLDGFEIVEMSESPYDSEAVLQALLAKFPNLLAGDSSGSGAARRWLLIGREASLPDDEDAAGRWSVDHLFVDQDAIPTLVEVKRSSDTRIRREVVGQMLDYAANAVAYWPAEELRTLFEQRCEAEGLDTGQELRAVVDSESDPDVFWSQVGANLKSGRLRLVFVADAIPRELRRVVEFLNEQMTAEVIAVEVKQYVGEGVRTLVPQVIGQTAAAEGRKPAARGRQWDETSFMHDLLERRGELEAAVARDLINWARLRGLRFTWGRGKQDGSFIWVLDAHGETYYPMVLWTYGRVEIQFQHLNRSPFDAFEARRLLLQKLNDVPGVSLSEDVLTRRPSIPLSLFAANPAALAAFKEALDWFCETVRASTSD
ncbi:MAG: hypothetical protein AB7L91_09735 [Dehalococcoidia bacterium]